MLQANTTQRETPFHESIEIDVCDSITTIPNTLLPCHASYSNSGRIQPKVSLSVLASHWYR